jgi:hypothetical protein
MCNFSQQFLFNNSVWIWIRIQTFSQLQIQIRIRQKLADFFVFESTKLGFRRRDLQKGRHKYSYVVKTKFVNVVPVLVIRHFVVLPLNLSFYLPVPIPAFVACGIGTLTRRQCCDHPLYSWFSRNTKYQSNSKNWNYLIIIIILLKDFDEEFYRGFHLIVCGLDSIVARHIAHIIPVLNIEKYVSTQHQTSKIIYLFIFEIPVPYICKYLLRVKLHLLSHFLLNGTGK